MCNKNVSDQSNSISSSGKNSVSNKGCIKASSGIQIGSKEIVHRLVVQWNVCVECVGDSLSLYHLQARKVVNLYV